MLWATLHDHLFNVGPEDAIVDGAGKGNQAITIPHTNGDSLIEHGFDFSWLAIRPPAS